RRRPGQSRESQTPQSGERGPGDFLAVGVAQLFRSQNQRPEPTLFARPHGLLALIPEDFATLLDLFLEDSLDILALERSGEIDACAAIRSIELGRHDELGLRERLRLREAGT